MKIPIRKEVLNKLIDYKGKFLMFSYGNIAMVVDLEYEVETKKFRTLFGKWKNVKLYYVNKIKVIVTNLTEECVGVYNEFALKDVINQDKSYYELHTARTNFLEVEKSSRIMDKYQERKKAGKKKK